MPVYSKAPSSARCIGPQCTGCQSPNCMSEGGSVSDGKQRYDNEKGVNKPSGDPAAYSKASEKKYPLAAVADRRSQAGRALDREDVEKAKDLHARSYSQLRMMPNPKLKGLAKGGRVNYDEGGGVWDNIKSAFGGDSAQAATPPPKPTGSNAGSDTGAKKLGQGWKAAGFADGGEVDDQTSDDSDDSEIHDMLGHEMMDAIHSKDHKRIMDGIEACVLNCMTKKG